MARKSKKSRRARGSGSIFFNAARQRWVGRLVVGKKPNGKPLTVEVWGRTQGEVVRRMATAKPPGPEVTVGAWVTHWLTTLTVRGSTRRGYTARATDHIVPHIGHMRLADVTAAHVEALAARLGGASELGPGTVNGILGTLRTMFSAAIRAGVVSRNPVSAARKPRNPKRKVVPWTVDELRRIIAAADTYSAGRAVALMAGCGCRVGEVVALEVPDFDPSAGTIAITKTAHQDTGGRRLGPPKSPNSVRTIRVPAAILPTLAAAAGRRTAGPLFVTAANRRYAGQMVSHALGLTLDALGLDRRTAHVLRHSVASHLVAAAVPIADVAKYLGDSVETVVRTYLHPTGADPADALDRLYGGRKVGARGKAAGPKARKA